MNSNISHVIFTKTKANHINVIALYTYCMLKLVSLYISQGNLKETYEKNETTKCSIKKKRCNLKPIFAMGYRHSEYVHKREKQKWERAGTLRLVPLFPIQQHSLYALV